MKKLTGTTPDLTKDNVDKLTELFPNVVTEKEGEDGIVTRSVDFDLLRQMLSDSLVEGADERYRLDWPGKHASLLKANTPIAKTLRPDRNSSVDFDTTQNVFIEGDNFEALKILQESYLGKVKMIYIDPPYNTGKDFVYSDNFTQDKAEYDEEIEAVDEEGNKMFKENTRTNPRFHSDWLSMMYERLIISRDLLRDDGVIFISIDDNEAHNLRKVCDEIFGEDNLLSENVVIVNPGGRKYGSFSKSFDRMLVYSKSIESAKTNEVTLEGAKFSYQDDIGGYNYHELLNRNIRVFNSMTRPNLRYPFYVDLKKPNEYSFFPVYLEMKDGLTEVWGREKDGLQSVWTWGKEKANKNITELFATVNSRDGSVQIQRKLRTLSGLPNTLWPSAPEIAKDGQAAKYTSFSASQELQKLFDNNSFFDFPKPLLLLRKVIQIGTDSDSIILDFFSGSATTAHAVMAQNAEDGGNRKFIMVQLAEETPEGSEASKAGYMTIAELGRERIRRAAAKIRIDYADKLAECETPLDIGFRAYTVADTAFLDVERHPSELEQGRLLELANNIKGDRTPEDLLTQVMLELGLTLDLPIETKLVGQNTVFYVAGNALVACFDESIPTTLIDEMAKCQPLQVAFKDASFGSDDSLINAETYLKRLSPDTILSVI